MIGTLLGGRFRLERKLGSGGMSTVYRAFDETLERWVAIKVMHADSTEDPSQIERFRREARAVARLSHPHVVSVIDAGEDQGHPYIVLEYVEGETLKSRIRREGPLEIPEAVAYAIEIAKALAGAHAARLVHRDVKPQNVLIDLDGRAKLTDFGISRSLEVADGLTQAGKVVGTTDYVSPEQALGHDVSGQSDIYSLGICLYEMLAGRPPFSGESHVAVAMKHVQEPVPDVRQRRPEVSAVLASVIERATSKELGNRYQSIDEMVADLEQALAIEAARSGEVTGEATAVLQQLPRSARRLAPRRLLAPRRIAVALLVVLALAGATYAAVLLIPGGSRLVRLPGIDSDLTKVKLGLGSARDFDPEGDGSENSDGVDLAIDGNRSTYWDSEGYQTEFGPDGLKSGVGLVIDAGTPVAARQLDLITRTEGIDLQVYAAEQPSEDLGGWGPVIGSATDAKEVTEIDLDTAGQQFQYYLLWITRVVSDGDANRASISELILRQ